MNKRQTFFIAALEAAILVAISLGFVLVPLSLVWLLENNPDVDWLVAFRAAADFWLLSHGTGLVVPEGEILGLLVPAFMVTLVPLGMTIWLARSFYNAGKRFLAARSLWPGWLGGALVYGAAALGISTAAYDSTIYPVAWQGVFFPTILFLTFQILGSVFGQPDEIFEGDVLDQSPERDRIRGAVNSLRLKLHWSIRSIMGPAFRAGTAITVMLLMVSAFTVAVLIAISWIDITRLYESVQVSFLGAVVLTIGQLALIPNLVIYGAAWFTGVGFSIGAGSLISPLGSQVGPLPTIPILGALPVGQLEFGMVSIVVVLLAAFIATLAIRKSADEIRFEFATAWTAAISLGLSIALVTALQMALLATIASGSAGPGRLVQVGVSPWLLALVVFVEVGVVATLAAFYSARPVEDKPAKGKR
ncbi:MAG: hypothetical protein F2542_01725 [Actinobacteria bacterium]|uniref:Unannotated protein n=1 Tax=freshwater metagenome TaxID=449393 RepID=A0A6J6CND9_9ZZZZ|nr:hypothetical protein [Actinomycetota bacterium]